MSGINGDEEEQPARRRAGDLLVGVGMDQGKVGLQSNMTLMAMRIIKMWWYPRNGMNPVQLCELGRRWNAVVEAHVGFPLRTSSSP